MTEPYVENPLGMSLKKPDSAFRKYRKGSNWLVLKPDDEGSVFRSTEFKGTRPVTGDQSIASQDRLKIPNLPKGMEIEDMEVSKTRFNTAQGRRPRDYKFLTKTVKGVSKLKQPRGSADLFDSA